MRTIKGIDFISPQSATYLALCLTGVLVLVFGGIVPAQRQVLQLKSKIKAAQENKSLRSFDQSLRSGPLSKSSVLTLPAKVVLQRSQITKANADIRSLAALSGMKVVSLVPDMAAASDPHVQAVNIALKGDFSNFRNALKKLGELPYVDQIAGFAIQQRGHRAGSLDFSVKILLSVK
jgi:hypothetical protein